MPHEPQETTSARSHSLAKVASIGAALFGVITTLLGALQLLLDTQGPRDRPRAMLPMHYTGEFRYQRLVEQPIWQAIEIVKIDSSVVSRLLPRISAAHGTTATLDPRLARALGREWRYQGTQGLHRRLFIYRRVRTPPVRLPPSDGTVSVVNQVPLPHIDLGDYRLIPDATSTMSFEGPKRVLRGTSPNAKPEHFRDHVVYTLPLRDLVRPPRLDIGHPTTAKRSFPERVIDSVADFAALTFHAVTSLIGLVITTVVTAIAGVYALDAWRRRHPEPGHGPP